VAELYQAVNTLEAYSIAECADYPAQDSTPFSVNSILTTSGTPSLSWNVVDEYRDCGQFTTIASNSNPNGQVGIDPLWWTRI
jgi:hypothetical protein